MTSISVCFAPIQACVIKNLTLPGEAWNSVTLFTLLEAERIESVSGSSKIQTLCHMTQVVLKLRFTAMERLRLLKLVFFTYKGTGILLTSVYITQQVLATPTLIGT